ncbi:MAG TPA: Rieske 2Fe-2S domain-containing protein [Burkholderiales bacterium]|nr:Rieske 2Fe-2S domain-containing protein [Burkholderiales bacterium]
MNWPAEGDSRVPYWVYTDEAIYRREIERIFEGPTWSYLALECELPKAGDWKRSTIGEKSVLVVRGEDGVVRGFLNRCAHRGVQLCQDVTGHVRHFRCPYHQWTYDLDGRLMGMPFRHGVKGVGGMPAEFDFSQHGLTPIRVAARGGAVFGSLSAEAPALEAYFGDKMLAYYDRVFDGRELRLLGYSRQRLRANWKLILENIKDTCHASLLHVFFVTFGLFRVDNPSKVRMDDTGLHTALISERGRQELNEGTKQMHSFKQQLALQDPRLLDTVREFPGDATVIMHTFWPNLILQQQSNTLATRQIVPRAPGEFDLHWTFFGYATDDEDMTRRRLRQANLMGPGGLVSMDDGEVIERAQQGFSSATGAAGINEMGGRDYADCDHMVTDVALRAFYRGYRNVMGL